MFSPIWHRIPAVNPQFDRIAGETDETYNERKANELDAKIRKLGAHTVSCYIMEPVVGAVSTLPQFCVESSLRCETFSCISRYTRCKPTLALRNRLYSPALHFGYLVNKGLTPSRLLDQWNPHSVTSGRYKEFARSMKYFLSSTRSCAVWVVPEDYMLGSERV